jgi:hypothetical protein
VSERNGINGSGFASAFEILDSVLLSVSILAVLSSTWHLFYADAADDLAKHWTERAHWDYYGYHKDSGRSCQDSNAPDKFRANLMTLSVRYAF